VGQTVRRKGIEKMSINEQLQRKENEPEMEPEQEPDASTYAPATESDPQAISTHAAGKIMIGRRAQPHLSDHLRQFVNGAILHLKRLEPS
jgi:hypothetical protein